MASKSASETNFAEPVLRPRNAPAHALDIARRARIYATGGELIVREKNLRERSYPVGEGGIARAVFIPPSDREGGARSPSADRWGVVDFQTADGQAVLEVPLAEWLPESGLAGLVDLTPEQVLERTGLRSLTARLRIPLGESTATHEVPTGSEQSAGRPDRVVHRDLPVWHSWLRGIGMLVWFVFFLILPMTGNGNPLTVLTAVSGLFLVPGGDLLYRLVLAVRTRKETSLTGAEVIRPCPPQDSGATRRFCESAAVHVLPGDVVLTNTVREERWLARNASHGVTRLVKLLDPSTGDVLGVEFRDGENHARALLPWRWWFSGAGGQESWNRLVSAMGVPVSEEKAQPVRAERAWWSAHPLAADVRKMSPLDPKEARQMTSWHSSVIGAGEAAVVPVLSLIPLLGLSSHHPAAQAAGILATLTILAELGPVLGHQFASRFKLDRPTAPESS